MSQPTVEVMLKSRPVQRGVRSRMLPTGLSAGGCLVGAHPPGWLGVKRLRPQSFCGYSGSDTTLAGQC